MSYTIEYAKLFLKSDSGYTPCWECGSNNVYENDRRRAREWCVWQNLLGVTPEEIMDEGLSMCNGSSHWQKGGKWLDDTALIRWIELGIAKAVTIEDVLEANPALSSIYCRASVWEGHQNRSECERYLRSTADLDRWIGDVNALKAPGISVYPLISLRYLKPVKRMGRISDFVLFKYSNAYLSAIENDGDVTTWSFDIRDALTYSREEALRLQNKHRYNRLGAAILIDAKNKARKKAVISREDGLYFLRQNRTYIYHTKEKESAKRYSSIASARTAAKLLTEKVSGGHIYMAEEE